MLSFFIMALGLGLMIWSLYSIRREIELGNIKLTKGLSRDGNNQTEKMLIYLDDLDKQIKDMNVAFYDLISDLEGNYSIQDKELALLDERLRSIENQLSMITSEVRIEHKSANISNPKKIRAYQEKKFDEGVKTETVSAMPHANNSSSVMSLSPDESYALKQKIISLRKEGHNLNQIAKILDIGIGELQLFIKLNTK